MSLVSFAVRNFRSIKKTGTLRFHDGLTTLIGPNNEGKSNILLALVAALEVASRLDQYTFLKGGRLRPTYSGERIYRWHTDFPISQQATHPTGVPNSISNSSSILPRSPRSSPKLIARSMVPCLSVSNLETTNQCSPFANADPAGQRSLRRRTGSQHSSGNALTCNTLRHCDRLQPPPRS